MATTLLGQARVVRFLSHAVAAGRLPHALLFLGPQGSGRETAARGLAAGLLCERRGHTEALPFGCGACRACRRIATGTHPDVHVLVSEAESVRRGLGDPDGKRKPSVDIKVDQVRELARVLRLKPYEGGARVAVVVDAHRMNDSAANALLKTLEEPSPDTCIVLTAPQERAVLRTIASRCQRLWFAPLSRDDVERVLVARGATDAAGRAALADGSVTAALALDPTEAHEARARAIDLVARLDTGSIHERMDAAESLGKERVDVDAVLATVERVLAAAVRAAHGHGASDVAIDPGRGHALLEGVAAAREALAMNGAVQLTLEELFLRPS